MKRRNKVLIKQEKEAVVYYMALKENVQNGKSVVSVGDFLNMYEKLFPMKSKNPYKYIDVEVKKIKDSRKNSYRITHKKLQDMSLEEVLAYRNTLLIIQEREIPEDLVKMAMKKDLYVHLQNSDCGLSGYSIYYKKQCITNRPYQLEEEEIRELIKDFPTSKEALIKQENDFIDMLYDESVDRMQKLNAIHNFKMLYTTHDFQKRINNYLFKYCKDKTLALATIGLCSKVGIVNMSNNKPILLRYCKASDKITSSNLKKTRRRRKGKSKK